VIAVAGLHLECFSLNRPFVPIPAAAVYSIFGGLATALARLLLAIPLGAKAGRLSSVALAFGFLWLHCAYFANVKLLPGEPYLSWKSLAVDLLLLAPFSALLWRLEHGKWFDERREAGRVVWAGATAVLIVVSAGTVAGPGRPACRCLLRRRAHRRTRRTCCSSSWTRLAAIT
jgi:hypothetical protein